MAIEFAEDPIEKTRQNRRGKESRVIPDRAKLEDIREQALNNFMLSPWGALAGQEEEKKDEERAQPQSVPRATAAQPGSKPFAFGQTAASHIAANQKLVAPGQPKST